MIIEQILFDEQYDLIYLNIYNKKIYIKQSSKDCLNVDQNMQKQLKTLQTQLQLNKLVRLSDPIAKQSNSLFRALSMSIFSHHLQSQYIRSVMLLTLKSNLHIYKHSGSERKLLKQNNAFPLIAQQSNLIKKFLTCPQMLQVYTLSPQLQCFTDDNYELLCYTFNRRLDVYYVRDGYLNVAIYGHCRKKNGCKIRIARLVKRYFAIQTKDNIAMTNFIKDFIMQHLINHILDHNDEKENKRKTARFLDYEDAVVPSHKKINHKIHKKSLSQCGDLTNKIDQNPKRYQKDEQTIENFKTSIKNLYDSIQNRSQKNESNKLLDQQDDFDDRPNVNEQTQVQGSIDQYQATAVLMQAVGSSPSLQAYCYPCQPGYYQAYPYYTSYYMQPYTQPYTQPYYPYYQQQSFSYPVQQLVQGERYRGKLKFFDPNGKYGFIVVDGIGTDLFVHYDDLSKAGITKEQLEAHGTTRELRFVFTYYQYSGKNKKAKKAIDLELLQQN